MKRFFKVVAWIIGTVAALLIAAAVYILLIFDPNKYKAEIAAAVHNATGRELVIQGDLKLSLFPWLGVQTGAMTLNNLSEFGPQPFAKIADAAIKVKLLPLLKKDVQVDTVTLNGLYLNLLRTAAGRGNWEDLTKKGEKEPAPAPAAEGVAAPALASFAIGGVRVDNATVIWDDRQGKARYELSNLSVHTGPVSLKAPVVLSLDTDVKSSAPSLTAHLNLTTRALYDFDTQRLQLKGLKLATDAHGPGLPADVGKLTVTADAALDLAENQYRLNSLKLLASLHGDKLPGKQVDAALDGNVALDLKKGTLSVDPFNFDAWNVKIKGTLQGRGLPDAPRFAGTLAVADFNARELLGKLISAPLNTADKQALSSVSADLEFNASTTDAELTKLDAKLDQTRITGKASLQNFAHPAYRFQLALDNVDADRYLPPATTANAKPVTPAAAAGAGAAELPLETLRALDVDGNLAVGKLKIAKLQVNDIKVGVNAKAGVIRANPLAAQLYGGSYRGDVTLDARGKTVQLAMNESLTDIAIGPLTQDLLQKDLVAGTGNVTMKLSGAGLDPEQLTRTLNGNVGFSLRNGRVNGVNLIEMIQKDYLKYIQGLAIDAGKLNQTVFSKFAATAAVTNGLINTNDLVLDSAQLNVKGRGTANLVDQQLALRLDALPVGQLAKQLGQFKDTVIPVKIEGTITAPKFSIELDEVLKQKAKALLEQEKQKAEAQLRKKADEEKAKLQQKLDQKQKQLEKKAQEQLQNKLQDLFK
jgi:AsmA protein